MERLRSRSPLFKPVDIVAGPDGALYISGWGEEYGAVWKDGEQANEGRIFRISWPAAPPANWNTSKRGKPVAQWTFEELVEDLGSLLPVWSIDAQDELVRRGAAVEGRAHGAAPPRRADAGAGNVGPVGAGPDRAGGPQHRRVVCRNRSARCR